MILRILQGAADAVGAHVARLLLMQRRKTAIVDPNLDVDLLKSKVRAALEESAWSDCAIFDETLLTEVVWVGGRPSLESFAASDAAGEEREWWHLEPCDRTNPPSVREHTARLRDALASAVRLKCRRFVYLSSLSATHSNDHDEAERALTSFCADAGLAFAIVRPSTVVGPFATLRSAGTAANLAPLRRWLSSLTRDSETSTSIVVNFLPADRFVADIRRIVDSGFSDGPEYNLFSGEDACIRFVATAAGEDEFLPLTDDGHGIAVRIQPTSFRRTLPAHPPLSVEAAQAYVEALLRDMRGTSVARVFTRALVHASDDTPLAVYECGERANAPLVLINAYGMPVEFWTTLGGRLASAFRVLTWETAGVPNPSGRRDPESIAPGAHANDLARLLDARGIDRADIVAWCNGAQVALAFAHSFPDRVHRIAFVGGTFQLDPPLPYTEYARMLVALAHNASQSPRHATTLSEVMRRQEAMGRTPANPDRIASAHLRHLCKLPYRTGDTLFRYARGIRHYVDDRISKISLPPATRVLVMTGGRDTMVNPKDPRWVASQIPNARLVEVPDADHTGMYDNPRVADEVERFFKSTD